MKNDDNLSQSVPEEIVHFNDLDNNSTEAVKDLNEDKDTPRLYKFEKIFNSIYGTQIEFLEYLIRSDNKRCDLKSARVSYQKHVFLTKKSNELSSKYFDFLERYSLIKETKDDSGNTLYEITGLGICFILYLKKEHPLNYQKRPL